MAHDVFVSYSSKDKAIADAIVSALENNQIRCWYAPRDIQASEDWGQAITNAIEASKVFLIIFSASANRSQRVLDELNLAITQQAIVLPFRIENLEPVGAMKLHLSSRHWLDAYEPSWESHIKKLIKNVSSNLNTPIEEQQIVLPAEIKRKEKAHQRKLNPIITVGVIAAFAFTSIYIGFTALNKNMNRSTPEPETSTDELKPIAVLAEPTNTSIPATPAPTITPTLFDSSSELGNPDYETDFQTFGIDNGEWDRDGHDADGVTFINDDGKLIVQDYFSLLYKGTKKYVSSIIEVDAKFIKNSIRNQNEIILICRADFPGGAFSGYSAGLSSEGVVSIRARGPFSPGIEIFSSQINGIEDGQVYRLRFDCEGKDIRFYVNGEMIGNIMDSGIYSGNIGLSSSGTVEFDNFKLWQP